MASRAPPRLHAWQRAVPGLALPFALLACDSGPTEPGVASDPPPAAASHAWFPNDAETIRACHGPQGSPFYRVGIAGSPDGCRSPAHREVTWPADGWPGPAGAQGPPGADGVACWDLDGDGAADPGEDFDGDGHFDAMDCHGPSGVFTGTLANPDASVSLVLDDDGIRLRTPGGSLEISGTEIRLESNGTLRVDGAAGLTVDAALTAELVAGNTLGLTAGLIDATADVVLLNGDCRRPVSRVGDLHTGHHVLTPTVFPVGFRTVPISGEIISGSLTVLTC